MIQFVIGALVQVVFRVKKPYMITRKGVHETRGFPMRLVMPYAALLSVALAACWFYLGVYHGGRTQGFLLFGLQDALLLWLLLAIVVAAEVRDKQRYGPSLAGRLRLHARPLLLTAVLAAFLVVTAVASAQPIWEAVMTHF